MYVIADRENLLLPSPSPLGFVFPMFSSCSSPPSLNPVLFFSTAETWTTRDIALGYAFGSETLSCHRSQCPEARQIRTMYSISY